MNKTHILVFRFYTWFCHKIHLNILVVILQHLDRISCSDPTTTRNEPIATGMNQISVGSIATSNKPYSNFWSQTASVHAEQEMMYSASAILSAIIVFFLLNHDIIAEPKLKQNHEVFFLSLTYSAQSESMNPCNLSSQSTLNQRPYPIVPFNYLITCFVATM